MLLLVRLKGHDAALEALQASMAQEQVRRLGLGLGGSVLVLAQIRGLCGALSLQAVCLSLEHRHAQQSAAWRRSRRTSCNAAACAGSMGCAGHVLLEVPHAHAHRQSEALSQGPVL